jgi:peptide/nickel transport system ATP-binding protein
VSVEHLLDLVRLPTAFRYRMPRELSGGERQRVCIARALGAAPDLIVCDEITSALDVSVQASVLKLLKELQRDLGLSLLFITHDMGVVSYIADEVIVLESGRVCERGATRSVLLDPQSEYVKRLMDAVPSLADE